jgi:oligopeptide transport system ATP-binding protein
MALLTVENLGVSFVTRNGVNRAVDGISFSVESGKITAIIGESGSGKSVACYSMLGLVPMPPGRIDSGRAIFEGQDLLEMSEAQLRAVRGDEIAMIFQDPMTCLNPYLRIGEQLIEPLVLHRGASRSEADGGLSNSSTRSVSAIPTARSTAIPTSSPAACASG